MSEKKEDGNVLKAMKGIGRVIFSQGLFVIIIVIITSIVCYKVKKLELKNATTSQVIKKDE
ncbi:hypothetical protein CDU01_20335 [Cronobacter sakazakii]|uniref:hypothetical protein n=1 Tax=Cronobacter TaxID=413496 RepID=UPI000BE7BC37|nr:MULTISPECIES: hypothetical protein [Cronobacter]EBX8442750.1 hypothetical protein [Salmonella enterica subsp. enterica serovar Oranienburg]ELY2676819.1 hypothetical protein [Cronobacter sakazakii]ELY2751968.1 hypothetical protein [Cronobacter sakazakii]ELY2794063.1 hypothetical protein [Cronobacter sakazakii]ELY2905553.1 hypothetical protein [Cronobacter sakazakii]